ncbi:MAG TPA: hypothetical protein VFZ83_06740, partial [Acidimicrobiia bacterium]|nr:hypothetical protein [Acidimicrobiia bacterium]
TTEPAPRAPRAPVEGVSWAADEPEAAFVALERQAHALFARPHPLRLAEVVVPDTALYRQWDARLRALSRAGRAERQPGSTLVDVQVTTDTPEIVYLRVTYHDTVQETLDRAGTVIAVEPMAPTSHWVVVMQRDRTAGIARWRFVAIDRSVRDLEISL